MKEKLSFGYGYFTNGNEFGWLMCFIEQGLYNKVKFYSNIPGTKD